MRWFHFALTLAVVPFVLFFLIGVMVMPGTGDRFWAAAMALVCGSLVVLGFRRFFRGRAA